MSLIPVAGIVIGIGFLAWAVHAWREGEKVRRWPSVPGEITGVQVEERTSMHRPAEVDYEASVTYRYSVRGRTYDGSRIVVGGGPTTKTRDAQPGWTRKYRPGMKVTVFHNPADPSYAILEFGTQYTTVALLLFLAAMSFGISVTLWH